MKTTRVIFLELKKSKNTVHFARIEFCFRISHSQNNPVYKTSCISNLFCSFSSFEKQSTSSSKLSTVATVIIP